MRLTKSKEKKGKIPCMKSLNKSKELESSRLMQLKKKVKIIKLEPCHLA
jgi:hypothetical protein